MSDLCEFPDCHTGEIGDRVFADLLLCRRHDLMVRARAQVDADRLAANPSQGPTFAPQEGAELRHPSAPADIAPQVDPSGEQRHTLSLFPATVASEGRA